MPSEQKKISFLINGANKIPAMYVAEILQHLQNILYSIGDHIEGNAPRPKGDYPQSIKDYCSLFINNLSTGSILAEMQIGGAQESLPEMQTLGERSISIANDLINLLSEGDLNRASQNLPTLIDDPRRLNRILREFDAIWPDSSSNINISFNFGQSSFRVLNPAQKIMIQSLLQRQPEEYEKEIFGRFIELRVDQKRHLQIDSPEGLIVCQYAPEIQDFIIKYIGELVRVRGLMTPTQTGKYVLQIEDETSLETITKYQIKSFALGSKIKLLSEPLSVDVIFDNDQYIVSNDELGLLAVANSMKSAVEEIEDELAILYSEYVAASENELSPGARRLRGKLMEILA
ncbi:MAG: hypothetical protein ABOK23_06880 [Candidatus Methanoperedens sp.]|nr:hypothetical protein [Candidatus Methanoperedens sp.]